MMKNSLLVALASLSLAGGSAVINRDPIPEAPAARARTGAAVGKPASGQPTWDSVAEKFGGTKHETKPCKDVTMSFTIASEVREVKVVGGQMVKEGDLLVRA